MVHAKRGQESASPVFGVGSRHAVRVHGREAHVLEGRQMFEQTVKLKHQADLTP
jgi:hypothetical protein